MTAALARANKRHLAAQRTSLYRFYDSSNVLLYVGITNSLPTRFGRHDREKHWYPEVAYVKIQHFPDREAALEAERLAIIAERPRFNVQHNNKARDAQPNSAEGNGRWRYFGLRGGFERREDMWLYPELDGSSVVDDYYDLDGRGQLREYIRYLVRGYPDELRNDRVPIYWSVQPAMETAPPFLDPAPVFGDRHFLKWFTWPEDPITRERLDWFSLPVVNDRFPDFADALAWTPSPLQPFCPLRTILTARGMGHYFEGL